VATPDADHSRHEGTRLATVRAAIVREGDKVRRRRHEPDGPQARLALAANW